MGKAKKPTKTPQPLSPRIIVQNIGGGDQRILVAEFEGLAVADGPDIIPDDKARSRSVPEHVGPIAVGDEPSISGLSVCKEARPEEEFLEVRSTADRGLAVFATRKIKAGTLVLVERALIALDKDEENDYGAVERAFSRLSRAEQKMYLRLFDAQKSRMSRVVSIYYSNCYNCEAFRPGGQGGSAIGALSSRINHSCVPNVQFSFDEARNEMRFYAIRDIPRGKEVCSNYDKAVFEVAAKRQRKQQMYYGFVCRCEACDAKTEFWAKSDERRRDMCDAIRAVQWCEKKLAAAESGAVAVTAMTSDKGQVGARARIEDSKAAAVAAVDAESVNVVVDEALAFLTKLESLLLKESLVGVPLANTYRSMAKWAERKGDKAKGTDEAVKWKIKELEACVTALGREGHRTKEIETWLERHSVLGG
ncbi:hypothetical protein Z517_11822 [Fonsecaea pedrosoi CBS 271.37]|uniref:SET domain-containing protein n=1 Tax=Fonsecaea pedrosoi CBS 271.37 TaxID=1442368 RepID=A0A0D2DBU0_9EURO|nr:uncharacterized protein Z517_11822 [Fonsecaea pedrosoi CBS 271.37]KIW75051.1 hypothetical protein Z517_11822 [Fonsecaea pedrosoi CBS 271.37]